MLEDLASLPFETPWQIVTGYLDGLTELEKSRVCAVDRMSAGGIYGLGDQKGVCRCLVQVVQDTDDIDVEHLLVVAMSFDDFVQYKDDYDKETMCSVKALAEVKEHLECAT